MISDVHSGDDVLEWLNTADADQQARRVAIRRGLGGADALAGNLLHDARFAVWMRMQSSTPLEVDNPAGYGTQVLKSVVRKLAQGWDGPTPEPTAGDGPPDGGPGTGGWNDPTGGAASVAPHAIDDLRVVVERLADRHAWVTSAMLSLVTLRAYPEIELDGVPLPDGGATPEQALGWPALWFAGRRDIFPEDGDTHRERARKNTARSRLTRKLLARLELAGARYRAELGVDDG